MKAFVHGIVSGFVLMLIFYLSWSFLVSQHERVQQDTHEAMLEAAWNLVCEVESGFNPNAVGDGGNAIGIAQIHQIMVDDCNRILGEEKWDHSDAWEIAASRDMFMTYSTYYADFYDDWSLEGVCRRWNSGPRGHQKHVSQYYWKKIQLKMDSR